MARSGVTVEQVAEAIESLEAAGLTSPSIRMIHQKLGTGSLTTLSRHKRTIEAERREQGVSVLPDVLDDGLRELADALWAQVSEAADAIIEKREAAAEEREKTATQRIAQAMEEVSNKTSDLDRSNQRIKKRDQRIVELEKEVKQLTSDLQKEQVRSARVEERNVALENQVKELDKGRASDQKSHEKALEKAVAIRNTLQEKVEAANEQLNVLQQEFSAYRGKKESELEQSAKEAKQQEQLLKQANTKIVALEKGEKGLVRDVENGQALLRQFKSELGATQKELEILEKEERSLIKQVGALENEVAVLNRSGKESEKAWKDRLKEQLQEKDRVIADLRGVIKVVKG